MVAVAVAAFGIGGVVLVQRYLTCRALARQHRAEQAGLIEAADQADAKRRWIAKLQAEILAAKQAGDLKRAGFLWTSGMPTDAPMSPEVVASWRSEAAYHGAMAARYERAIRFPWLTVAPDTQ